MGDLQEGGLQDTKVLTSLGEVQMAKLGIGQFHRVARPGFVVFHDELHAKDELYGKDQISPREAA